MKSIILNQERTIKQKIFGVVIIAFSLVVMMSDLSINSFIVAFFIFGLIVFGLNLKIKIKKQFLESEKQFCIFSIKLFSSKLGFPYPDYVSLFSTTLKGSNEYGAVSAVGRRSSHDKIVLKLFKEN